LELIGIVTALFDIARYLRPNYQSGANMLRGDLPVDKTRQSWFNTKYGPTSLAPGFLNQCKHFFQKWVKDF